MKKILKFLPLAAMIAFAGETQENSDTNTYINLIEFSQKEAPQCNVRFTELLRDGLTNHPSITMSKKMIESAKYNEDYARWGYYPSPSITHSMKNADERMTSVKLEQPLWTGGKLDAELKSANLEKQSATQELRSKQYSLVEDYLDTLQQYQDAKDKINALSIHQKDLRELKDMLERMIKAGELSQSDKNILNAKLATVSSELVVLKAKFQVAKVRFEILTNKKIDCNIEYTPTQALVSKHFDIYKMIQQLNETHPKIKIVEHKIAKAISEINLSKSKLWPSLMLVAEHKKGTIYEDSTGDEDNLMYLQLRVATGAGLQTLSSIEKAKIDVSKVEFEKYTQEKELVDELMKNYTSYMSAKNNIDLLAKELEISKEIYESNKKTFSSNQKKWTEVMSSLDDVKNKTLKYKELLNEKNILAYKLMLKTGEVDLIEGGIIGN